ncbi:MULTISPECIES: DUF5130 family protein [Pseudonocardia]|uniref:DUF5130 domain-containing protein n=2 Tax=Pseudonocardia TaxID=1847 RepID=A0A1Y2N9E4_PSEAH|nr:MULTISPECIES: DUF5130 family protein [Pseudonocardia]OSY43677.1 hypothetical protein BG845_00623 [Pseudonocardia autotrophica]TDN73333.1 uncharacterized protein DUF5130 [Pseudonocardia autotrophica]BBG04071.1 hypothetical protein Pdca_52800 [Pseudonocardia autotrophica]GEC26208.1 hypothetical protein PSA01_32370 [Pseudonocardia saturnea]
MGSGSGVAVFQGNEDELPEGSVVTNSGRLSVARAFHEPDPSEQPFTPVQLSRLDDALTLTSRETGLRFALYLGDLGDDARRTAVDLHGRIDGYDDAVLVAVSPKQRLLEIVTGAEAKVRLPDRGAKLALMSMVASFKEGDLFNGLLSGLRMLADQAGTRH